MPPKSKKTQSLSSYDEPFSLDGILREVLAIAAGVRTKRQKQSPVDLIEIGLAAHVNKNNVSKSWSDVLRCIITDLRSEVDPERFPFMRVRDLQNPTGAIPLKAFWIGRLVDVDEVKKQIILPGEKVIQIEGLLRATNSRPTEAMIAIVEVVRNPDHSTSFHDAVFHAVPTATRWWT
jgi:hypothetical protein